jgi:predicted O-linked N-acetylglucosamine transferase (SPINDLY family)
MTVERELRPPGPDAWFSRGVELQQQGAFADAIGAYGEALRGRPAFPEACNNIAAALRALRRLAEAQSFVDRALLLRPGYARALNNRGLIALDQRHGAAAVGDFRSALALEPRFPEALHNLATALLQLKRYAEAHEAYARLERLAPGFPHARGNALYAQLWDCDWRDFESRASAVTHAIARGEHAATPMSLLCMSGSAALQLRCAQLYTQGFFPAAVVPAAVPPRARAPAAPLRIGYLSGDLGEHAVSYLLAGVIERHDRARFETFAFAWGRGAGDAMRRRLEGAFTRFIEADGLADEAVVRLMRDFQIDIAVDLCGHTEGQRTGILARRAAPIQVNFLGLPASMGAGYVDYLIADPWLVPPGSDQYYAERIVRLAGGFQPNDDRRAAVPPTPPRQALGLPGGARVLASFNRTCKITPPVFAVWMRLLAALPDSVLWLPAAHEAAAGNLRREAAARGIAAARLIFAAPVGYAEYLARYRHAELFLDTAPFNGGATVSDALSMAVPVVTLAGESFAGRMAGSALEALGMPELVTRSLAEYETTALALARDPARLSALRQRLAQAQRRHAFFDTDRYRVCLEAAYQAMAARQAAGLAPDCLTIGAGGGAPEATAASSRSNGPT